MIDIVDYNRMWRIFRRRNNNSSFDWDSRAASFNRAVSGTSDETLRNVEALGLLPADTVLDMGAGTGRYAVPLAQHAAHVTVLEPSKGMLAFLEENMRNAGLSNYSVINRNFEDIEAGKDIPVHDVVFASNSLGFDDLKAGLEKLNSLAKRTVNILWFAGPMRHMPDPELMKRLGAETSDMTTPDYLTIVHVLHSMGIYPNVSVEKSIRRQSYDSPDEAADFWIDRGNYTEDMQEEIREYMRDTLIPDDNGRFRTERVYYPVRIWWNKEDFCNESGL
ncbi:class I SAM-dependent methyltransferase [Methanoplanus endosymbiosus]|uniref:Class I SAM-dependent methyltransferase n=1 Tax=Methanoplanus endosymbiosus TaxID=33865 RepID=A0A9E7PN71_9EURY|nr:class I SAM-dependent methyltransferase [Methanoplanus endosymbiosus]UUX93349.1 class I SAM-dependent methyltransferase [Methanoplanus endosymbiosus]